MQRHHLFPHQLLTRPAFCRILDALGSDRLGYDDFRKNGLLLPATESAAVQAGLPMHRGPHRAYNEMVIERFGQIEQGWSATRCRAPEIALDEALMRLDLFQSALRKRLLRAKKRPFLLNRKDPLGQGLDFSELDAMADALWASTGTGTDTGGCSRSLH